MKESKTTTATEDALKTAKELLKTAKLRVKTSNEALARFEDDGSNEATRWEDICIAWCDAEVALGNASEAIKEAKRLEDLIARRGIK